MRNLLTSSLLCSVIGLTSFGLIGCGASQAPAPTVKAPQHDAHGGERAKAEAEKYKGGKPRAHGPK